MIEPLVYIIIVNYNNYKDTSECIESLKKITYKNYKVIVVDNASKDNSAEMLKKRYENVEFIKNKYNYGFASANNKAMKVALSGKSDYLLLLNNDTIVESDFLSKMISVAIKDEDIGIVGCKIKYYNNTNLIWYGGGRINWLSYISEHINFKKIDNILDDTPVETEFVTGCVMLISKKLIEKIGFLPEDYFMYFEDFDFCVRAKQEKCKLYYVPKAVVYHKCAASSGGEDSPFLIKYFTRNKIIFMKRYNFMVSGPRFFYINFVFYLKKIVRVIIYFFKRDFKRCNAILEGLMEGIKYKKNNNLR